MSSPAKPIVTNWRHNTLAYVAVAGCWILYALLSLLAPQTGSSTSLSGVQSFLVKLTIIIPVALIWTISLRGALAFKRYANLIKESAEARGVNLIANGLIWTVSYVVLIGLIGAIIPYTLNTPWHDPIAILRDHLPAWTGLVAFVLIYLGSHQLRMLAVFATWTLSTYIGLIIYAVFSGVFVLAFFAGTSGSVSESARNSASILPPGVVLVTLILPYLLAWFLGLLAGINITKYAHKVKGILYRQALRSLVRGIRGIISFAIVLQLLTFSSRFLVNLKFQVLILIVYLILILYGLGFVFVHSGAKKLTRIEVVE